MLHGLLREGAQSVECPVILHRMQDGDMGAKAEEVQGIEATVGEGGRATRAGACANTEQESDSEEKNGTTLQRVRRSPQADRTEDKRVKAAATHAAWGAPVGVWRRA